MKKLLILLAIVAFSYAYAYDHTDEQIIVHYEPFVEMSNIDDQELFVDDFDTTFEIYGCTYKSWKK